MKKILSFFLALTLLSLAQKTPTPAKTNDAKSGKPQFILELEALTEDQRTQYFVHYREAERFFKQKRIFECIDEVHQAHKIHSKNPATLNLLGACYVEFRNFKKARRAFAKALKANPKNFNVRFNLAEIDFVTKKYGKALEQLRGLEKEAEGNEALSSMAPLVKFKILLCLLKLDDKDGARKILDATDFLDDSPLFYYGNAAFEYFENRGPSAEAWLARADKIFTNSSTVAPWQDTLIEFGYIKSFYGGDLSVEQVAPSSGTQ